MTREIISWSISIESMGIEITMPGSGQDIICAQELVKLYITNGDPNVGIFSNIDTQWIIDC